uniref:uncharacterized protein LOC129131417 n=1 Tax=Agelaius phoeniceus TaxID=39638 RepID=UPI0023EB7F0D|nr:uncharacterized protein LOC129131417 [Agelaius phoeniceus]
MSRARGSPGNGGAGAAAATARPLTRRRKWRERAGARPGGTGGTSASSGREMPAGTMELSLSLNASRDGESAASLGRACNTFLERVGTERIEAETGVPLRRRDPAAAGSARGTGPLSTGPGGSRGGRSGGIPTGSRRRGRGSAPRTAPGGASQARLDRDASPAPGSGTAHRRLRAGPSRDITAHPEAPRRRWMLAGAGFSPSADDGGLGALGRFYVTSRGLHRQTVLQAGMNPHVPWEESLGSQQDALTARLSSEP